MCCILSLTFFIYNQPFKSYLDPNVMPNCRLYNQPFGVTALVKQYQQLVFCQVLLPEIRKVSHSPVGDMLDFYSGELLTIFIEGIYFDIYTNLP